ncbi:MAG: hypothetical protein ABIP61_02520 [Burkholderiaceae bacterium]
MALALAAFGCVGAGQRVSERLRRDDRFGRSAGAARFTLGARSTTTLAVAFAVSVTARFAALAASVLVAMAGRL